MNKLATIAAFVVLGTSFSGKGFAQIPGHQSKEQVVTFKENSLVPRVLQKEVMVFLWNNCGMFAYPNDEAFFSIQELSTKIEKTVVDQYIYDLNYEITLNIKYTLDGYHPGGQVLENQIIVYADQFGPNWLAENPKLFCN